MTRTLRISPRAEDDLRGIVLAIDLDSPRAAIRFAAQARNSFETIHHFPFLGRRRRFRHPALPALRSRVLKRFVIFYSVTAEGVWIARIVHGSRQITGKLLADESGCQGS